MLTLSDTKATIINAPEVTDFFFSSYNSVTVKWEACKNLPAGVTIGAYKVYIDGQLKATVAPEEGVNGVYRSKVECSNGSRSAYVEAIAMKDGKEINTAVSTVHLAYFILTCGLSFLETSSNPYILSMGTEETATRRLNLAQSFNPMGSLLGMFVAMNFIQAKISPLDTAARAQLNEAQFEAVKESDLSVLIGPYLAIGIVILAMFMLILFKKMPHNGDKNHDINFVPTLRRIFSLPHYREGVIAQFFYVGVQIMCWTFIIQYGTRILMAEGMTEQAAEVMSQQYNIIAMIIFCCSRFICTFLLRYVNTGHLLMTLAIVGGALVCGVIFLQNIYGLYCLVGVSACMSLMFPTIYGIALTGLGDDAKFGAAGLIMSILGGSVLPPLQASIIDCGELFGMPAVNVSFVLPFVCFVVIAIYGQRTYMRSKNKLNG